MLRKRSYEVTNASLKPSVLSNSGGEMKENIDYFVFRIGNIEKKRKMAEKLPDNVR